MFASASAGSLRVMTGTNAIRLWTLVRLALAALFFLGCHPVPEGRQAVNAVSVNGSDKVDADDVTDAIATTPSPKFLGMRGVVYDQTTFDRNVLQRDLARVELLYRKKGFYEAHARAGRIHQLDAKHVEIEIVVEEGEAILVRSISIEGIDDLPPNLITVVRRAAGTTLPKDKPFDEEEFEKIVGAVRRSLTDRAYAYTKVTHEARVDLVAHRADVVLKVTHGEPCVFGKLTIEGLGPLPEVPVRRAFDLREGAPYSEKALDEAEQALLDLGVFASVDIDPELPDPPRADHIVPIHLKVEPGRLRTIKLGGGIEFDQLKSDVHGIVGWEHRNFLGGLRTFSVNFRPGVVLYPLRIGRFEAPTRPLPEERLRLELKQPGFIEARTVGFIRPEFNVQGLFLPRDIDVEPENERVLGYAEFRNGVGVERSFKRFFASVSHNLQFAYPFMYVGARDPTLGNLLISYPEVLTQFDFRDNRIHPRKGVLLSNTFQVGGYAFGGQADDIKVQPQVSWYVPLARRVVFASRATVGFLFPKSYGNAVQNRDPNAPPSEERTRDYQLTFFRGFFSGGPSSNRGYPLRAVGPHDDVPFLSPEAATAEANAQCDANGIDCRVPTGGFSLWEASAELRINVDGPLYVATFCDASDVSPQTTDLRFDRLHLSCGAGGRYDTPVGPVRLDIGYRIPGAQRFGGQAADERAPDDLLGIPIAVSFGIGEAF